MTTPCPCDTALCTSQGRGALNSMHWGNSFVHFLEWLIGNYDNIVTVSYWLVSVGYDFSNRYSQLLADICWVFIGWCICQQQSSIGYWPISVGYGYTCSQVLADTCYTTTVRYWPIHVHVYLSGMHMAVACAITFSAHHLLRFCFIVTCQDGVKNTRPRREISTTGRPVDLMVNSKKYWIYNV